MDELYKKLKDCGAIQFGDYILSSGTRSNYYIDIKKAITSPGILCLISKLMSDKMNSISIKPNKIAGIVLGSIPLATALSMSTGIPYVMVRKKKKDHGTEKLIEGNLDQGDNVLVIEDVITTGKSSINAIKILRDAGAIVTDIISVVSREEGGGKQNLLDIGVNLETLLKSSDLISNHQ